MINFLIIDDHPLFREALGNAIQMAHPDAGIFEAMSIEGALNVLSTNPAIDLALLDLSLPDATDFSGFLRLRENYPRLPVAIVSSHEDRQVVQEALTLGAAGYLPKSISKSELAVAIRLVLSGSISIPKGFVLSSDASDTGVTEGLRARLQQLTPQQLRVLGFIRCGLQNKQIAIELKLAESTVKAHVTEILRKLKLFSRNKAIIEIGKLNLPTPANRSRPKV